MKFTSEDLLKAMGLKVNDVFYMPNPSYKYLVCKQVKTNEITIYDYGLDKLVPLLDFLKSYKMLERDDYTIIQPKPTLTEDEKVILRNLPKEYEWIDRAEDNELCIFESRPIKRNGDLFCSLRSINIEEFNHLFQFIKWEDEPYSIEELLKE